MQNETDPRQSAEWHCECGTVTGTTCYLSTPVADTVLLEWMPPYLRESHRAARNYGVWPANGAVRIRVSPECADMLTEEHVDGEPAGKPDPWVLRIDS